ncbi:hypothetical protein [Vreelandella sp. EE22]
MEWLNENSQLISAFANICTLFVWVFYAQLLYYNFSRQRRPRIIINRGKGIGTGALCLISNMSNESIYVQHVVAVLHTREQTYQLDVVEYQQNSDDDSEDDFRTHQGPLASGDYIHIQTFGSIVSELQKYWEISDQTLDQQELQIEIRVIAIYGPEDMPIGATRHFKLAPNAKPNEQLVPVNIDTQRMSKRRERKQVIKWAEDIETHKAH